MQTFLPYASFEKSAKCLDNKRLGKQRVEAMQILNTLEVLSGKVSINCGKCPGCVGIVTVACSSPKKIGWKHHSAVKMWRGYEDALRQYLRCMIIEWVNRGFANSISIPKKCVYEVPPWVGNRKFHNSHRSNLLRKSDYYAKYFKVEKNLPYVWPKGNYD